ncbi:MAG: DNA polymerase III subunit [Saccharofermentanales bacterium]
MTGFNDLLGQKALKARLGKAIAELPGHAFVFIGPDGIGKKSFAREFARALLCEHPDAGGGCGHCNSCRYFIEGTHPDYKELLLQDKDKTIKTDVIRKSICGDIMMMPQISSRKVYFVGADDLNEQGQNALLKTLEEPPGYAVIILAVSSSRNLLPTVLSRAVNVPFQRNTSDEVMQILEKQDKSKKGNLKFLAKFSGGIPGVALHFLDNEIFTQQREELLDMMSRLPKARRSDLLTDYFAFFDANKSSSDDLFGIMNTWVRDLLIYCTCKDEADLINEDKRSLISESCPDGGNSTDALLKAAQIIHSAQKATAMNSSFENCICNMFLQLRKELNNA